MGSLVRRFSSSEAPKASCTRKTSPARRTRTASKRCPSREMPSSEERERRFPVRMTRGSRLGRTSLGIASGPVLGQQEFVAEFLPQRPSQMGQVLAVNDFGNALGKIKDELHPSITAPVMADGGDIRRELIAAGGDIGAGLNGARGVQHAGHPCDGGGGCGNMDA